MFLVLWIGDEWYGGRERTGSLCLVCAGSCAGSHILGAGPVQPAHSKGANSKCDWICFTQHIQSLENYSCSDKHWIDRDNL